MQKAHDASKNDYWKNKPDITTPIIAEQLNRMETSMDVMDDRIVLFDSTKANQTDLLTCVASITLNTTTGILTVTLKNGTSSTIDTGLAKLAINFDYDEDPTSPHYQQIIMEMKDGTYKYIDLSALITQYEFTNTSTIAWTIGGDGKISAQVVNGSITAEKLQPNYLADITAQAQAAAASATNASGSALVSEGFAKGTQNGQPVTSESPYYQNNAEYFKDQAQSIVGSKVDSFNGRTGVVVPAQDDYTIGQIKATGTQGQVPTLNAQGKLEMATPASSGHTIQTPGGTDLTQRSTLQFSGGSASVNVYDDPTNQKTVVEIGNVHSYTISTSDWVANADSDASDFPYIAVITPNIYPFSATFQPSEVMLLGALIGDYPTSAELEEMAKVDMYVKFTSTSIRVRATEAPGTTLNLVIKK